jgi:transposase
VTAFLDDARIPVDNNASERALRVMALGRKNFIGARPLHASDSVRVVSSGVVVDLSGVDPALV